MSDDDGEKVPVFDESTEQVEFRVSMTAYRPEEGDRQVVATLAVHNSGWPSDKAAQGLLTVAISALMHDIAEEDESMSEDEARDQAKAELMYYLATGNLPDGMITTIPKEFPDFTE
jgi:hypothetical protein